MSRSAALVLTLCLVVAAVGSTACGSPAVTEATATLSPTTESPLPTQAQSPVATVSEVEASSGGQPEIPAPEEGRASIGGTLYTFSAEAPIPGTVFYLTPALGESNDPPRVLSGPHAEEGDVRGESDSDGAFVLTDVPPGSYYLAVWAPYDWILAVESPGDQIPRLITLEPGQREDLGRLDVAWP